MGYQNYKTKEFFLEIIPRHDPAYDEKTLCSWVRCPFIEFYSISHNFVKNNFADILDYIIYTVEKGYNIYVKVIQKFLSVRMPSMYHSPFIYGFDKSKRILTKNVRRAEDTRRWPSDSQGCEILSGPFCSSLCYSVLRVHLI